MSKDKKRNATRIKNQIVTDLEMVLLGVSSALAAFGSCRIDFTVDENDNVDWNFGEVENE